MGQNRPGRPGEGLPPWKLIVAVAAVAVLAVAVIVAQRPSSQVVSPTGPSSTSIGDRATTGSTVDGSAGAGTGDDAPTDTSIPSGAPAAEVVDDLEAALTAWAAFAGSGEVAVLADTFVIDGPQHRQLAEEVGALGDTTAGSYRFDLINPVVPEPTEEVVVVSSAVQFTQPSGDAFTYDWNIEMRWDDTTSRWRLWTVSTVR